MKNIKSRVLGITLTLALLAAFAAAIASDMKHGHGKYQEMVAKY